MKGFICFIVATIGYLVLGLIAWNIVCSNMEIGSKTLIELADYKLYTYSALTVVVSCCIWALTDSNKFVSKNDYDAYLWMIFIVAGVDLGIAIAVNHWETVWDTVATIFTFLYNVINIGLIALYLFIPMSNVKKDGSTDS